MQPAPSFFHQAAKAAWAAPLIGAFGGSFVRKSSVLMADGVTMLFVLIGLICAVIALVGMSRVGRSGILAPALIGLVLNLGLCAIFVSNVVGR